MAGNSVCEVLLAGPVSSGAFSLRERYLQFVSSRWRADLVTFFEESKLRIMQIYKLETIYEVNQPAPASG